MRLWDYRLIKFLPKSQLIAQWRELNSIYKKQDNHILINYIYDYEKCVLHNYTKLVVDEMKARGYRINKWDNYIDYFKIPTPTFNDIMFDEHNDEYLKICYYNLYEKHLRGQKDFTQDVWNRLDKWYKEENNG